MSSLSLTTLAWLAMAAYSLHIMEEFSFDWRGWARGVIKLPVEWTDFYVTNATVVALGIAQAMLAPSLPLAPLIFASLMLINAVFFHIGPMLVTRGRFSPGAVTAVILFLPVGISVWLRAAADGVLTLGAIVGGALIMAYPIVMLRLRSKPYFQQG